MRTMRMASVAAIATLAGCAPAPGVGRDADFDTWADVGSTAGDPCTDEHHFVCRDSPFAWGGTACCSGRVVSFDHGPCVPPPDGGQDTGDPCRNPAVQSGGCPCDPDAGTSNCDDRGVVLSCEGGLWRLTTLTCASFCQS